MADFVPVAEVAPEEFKPVAEVEGEFKPVAEVAQPSLKPVALPPGQSTPMASGTIPTPVPQAFPTEQAQQEKLASIPSMTAEQAEQLLMSPQATLPRFGKPGTITRGISEIASMPVEMMTAPASPLIAAAQAVPGLRELVDTTFAASLTKSAAQRLGEASVTGDKEQFVRGVGELVLGGLAAKGAIPQEKPVLLQRSEAELAKPSTERPADAIPKREAAPLPVDAPSGDSAKVGSQVRVETAPKEAPQEALGPSEAGASEGATEIVEQLARQKERKLIEDRLKQLGISEDQMRAQATLELEETLRLLEASRAETPKIPERARKRLQQTVAEMAEGRKALEEMGLKQAEKPPPSGAVTMSGKTTEGEPYHITDQGLYEREGGKWYWSKQGGERLEVTDAKEIAKLNAAAPISQGPGAASPGDVPKGSQLSQLTEAVKGAKPVKRSMMETVKGELATTKEQIGEVVTNALGNLKALPARLGDAVRGVKDWTDFRDALGKFSGALNRNDYDLIRFTAAMRKHVPNPLRRQAIINFIQAEGDDALLAQRAAASKGTLKRGYELASQLTPDEKTVAANVSSYFDTKLQQGLDEGILKSAVDNYVTQLWKRPNPVSNRLMGEAASGKLSSNLRYARQRIFASYFEGEQAGYKPRNKDIGAVLAAYDQAFSRALAGRALIKALHESTESDGRPSVEISGIPNDLSKEGGSALLIRPRAKPADLAGYRPLDHPALRGWKWAGTDQNGNPILYQGDMLVHPAIYSHLRNALSTSALRANRFMAGVLQAQRFLKQSKLSLSGFHFTQEAAHAAAHRVNPFAPVKIDFNVPDQRALVDHNLQIADYRGYAAFAEGISGAGGLFEKIPVVGRWLTRWNELLFQDYIPRLKMSMALDALQRNRARYGKQLSEDQLLDLTARESNAAFGEQNYIAMGRNPTVQDFLRLATLAPDFLEARAKFVGQAFTRYGGEQRIALLLQGATLYIGARLLNSAISGDPHWNWKDAFDVFVGKRRYGLRTVIEDTLHAVTDPSQFISARLSPLARVAMEFATKRDWRGIQRTSLEQLEDLARWFKPITVDQQGGIKSKTDAVLAGAGLTVRSATATQKVYELLRDFRQKNNLIAPSQKAGMGAPSEYAPLRNALLFGSEDDARDAYRALVRPDGGIKPKTPQQIRDHFSKAVTAPFSGSNAVEARFRASLDSKGRQAYIEARRERQQELSRLLQWQHRWR